MNNRVLVRAGCLVLGVMLLPGCSTPQVKTESFDEGAVAQIDERDAASESKVAGLKPSSMMKLYIYQDGADAKRNQAIKEPREGYFIEFALNREVESNQKPVTILYRD